MKTIQDLDVKDKNVLVRVDYNVPLKDGKVTEDLRIRASLPTLELLREKGAKKIILISHLGRPEGEDKSLSLKPVAEVLRKHLGNVTFVERVSGAEVRDAIEKAKDGAVVLLENLRFYPGEKANSEEFMKSIVEDTGAEVYVQDGFAVIHRAHASTDAVKNFLPVYAGLLVEKEVKNLTAALEEPAKPVLLVIGGSKVEDKQPLIDKFADIADYIFVGGKIAADGYQANNEKIVVADDFDENEEGKKLDVGPLSSGKLAEMIANANTIIWNGLLGYAEDPAYATASTLAAELIGEKQGATTIICGGDTTGFVENLIKDHKDLEYSLISTGGGAALEFLLGKELPGLKAIQE